MRQIKGRLRLTDGERKTLAEIGMQMHSLATWWDVLDVAAEEGIFAADSIAAVRAFLDDPVAWSAAHGGRGGG